MLEPIRLFDGGTGIRYEFPQLVQGADDIGVAMQTMRTKLDELDTSLRSKLANWDGGAYGNYEQTKLTWDTAARNIENLLGSISKAVYESSDRMAQQEMINAMRFQRG
jgi:early secretory antigenic target protein ESAT-6